MTPNVEMLAKMRDYATQAGHIFPEYAACETALETATADKGWFESELFLKANNCFGQKQRAKSPLGTGTLTLPTWEVKDGKYIQVPSAHWVKFATVADAFAQRMTTLKVMGTTYYFALRAKTGEEFIREVSAKWIKVSAAADGQKVFQFSDGCYQFVQGRWATDPARASKILEIYNAHKDVFST